MRSLIIVVLFNLFEHMPEMLFSQQGNDIWITWQTSVGSHIDLFAEHIPRA